MKKKKIEKSYFDKMMRNLKIKESLTKWNMRGLVAVGTMIATLIVSEVISFNSTEIKEMIQFSLLLIGLALTLMIALMGIEAKQGNRLSEYEVIKLTEVEFCKLSTKRVWIVKDKAISIMTSFIFSLMAIIVSSFCIYIIKMDNVFVMISVTIALFAACIPFSIFIIRILFLLAQSQILWDDGFLI